MTKYEAMLVAPDSEWKLLYKRDSINEVKRELAHISKKWDKYKYKFIIEPVIEDRGDSHWINIGLTRVVEAPEDLKFLEGKRMYDVIAWIVEKDTENLKSKGLI